MTETVPEGTETPVLRIVFCYQAGECRHYIVCNGITHLSLLLMRNRQTLNWQWQFPPRSKLTGELDKCDCLKSDILPDYVLVDIAESSKNIKSKPPSTPKA